MTDKHKSSLAMEMRKKAGLTQRQVAEKLGVTVTTVARWERGERIPLMYLEQVEMLLDLYQCSIGDLVAAYASREPIKDRDSLPDRNHNNSTIMAS